MIPDSASVNQENGASSTPVCTVETVCVCVYMLNRHVCAPGQLPAWWCVNQSTHPWSSCRHTLMPSDLISHSCSSAAFSARPQLPLSAFLLIRQISHFIEFFVVIFWWHNLIVHLFLVCPSRWSEGGAALQKLTESEWLFQGNFHHLLSPWYWRV